MTLGEKMSKVVLSSVLALSLSVSTAIAQQSPSAPAPDLVARKSTSLVVTGTPADVVIFFFIAVMIIFNPNFMAPQGS